MLFREEKIKFLNFISTQMDGLVYDFFIDNRKVQEKVCTPTKNYNVASIHKSGGTTLWQQNYYSIC